AALSAVVAVALWQSTTTGVTVGNFVAFVTAMLMLISPIRHLAEIASPITRGLAALERGLELIEQTAEQSGGTHRSARAQGELAWQDVWVRYPPRDEGLPAHEAGLALRGIDLAIHPGKVVAFVGPSGSGKTTLVNLLPRFVEAERGVVTLDGVPLPEWDL